MWDARVTASGRRRRGLLVVALGCVGLILFGVGSVGAGARPVTAHAAACGGGRSGSFYAYGGGTQILSDLDLSACVTGRLTVTFAGDPAAGCATEGLCGYSGTVTFSPGTGDVGDLNIVTSRRHGRRSTSASLSIGGPNSPTTSAVQRTVSGPTGTQTTSCSDNTGSGHEFEGAAFALPIAHGEATLDLDRTQPSILGSRCAGPLDVDLASVLPSRTVAIRTLERGDTGIDLTGGGHFAAHGLSGTVTSTLVLTLGRPQREKQGVAPPRPVRTTLTHVVTVEYRVAALTGDAVATVQSSATPAACGPFDACGLGGAITVLPGSVAHGSVFLTAESSHDTARQLRATLRGAGERAGGLSGAGLASVKGSVRADLTQDGATCSDAVALRRFSIRIVRAGPHLAVSLAPAQSQAADPLRTRCPGPDLGSHRFSSGELPASVLSRPAFSVTLHGRPFRDGSYRVTTRSALRLTLRRGATHVHAIRLPATRR
jgi:hypothetical protein